MSVSVLTLCVQTWLSQELEVRVSIREAKYHLVSLLSDRKTLTSELSHLKDKMDDTPPTKVCIHVYHVSSDGFRRGNTVPFGTLNKVKYDVYTCCIRESTFFTKYIFGNILFSVKVFHSCWFQPFEQNVTKPLHCLVSFCLVNVCL